MPIPSNLMFPPSSSDFSSHSGHGYSHGRNNSVTLSDALYLAKLNHEYEKAPTPEEKRVIADKAIKVAREKFGDDLEVVEGKMSKAKELIKFVEEETIAVIYKKGTPVAAVKNMDVMKWFSGHNLNFYSAMSSGEYEVKDVSSEEGIKIMQQLKGGKSHQFDPNKVKSSKPIMPDRIKKSYKRKYKLGLLDKGESMREREFEVSMRGGDQNATKTKKIYKTQNGAASAARSFMADFFPDEKLYLPLRSEQPEKSGDSVVSVWSAGTTASGQRVWVRGL